MTKKELIQIFQSEEFDDEHCSFRKHDLKQFPTKRSDLYAFLLLDSLVPNENSDDIVSWAGHDEICLSIDLDDLSKVATKGDVIDLIRCGIRYSSTYDSLSKFV